MQNNGILFFWLFDIVLTVLAVVQLYRDTRFSRSNDGLWALIIVIIPIVGPLFYFLIRKARLREEPA